MTYLEDASGKRKNLKRNGSLYLRMTLRDWRAALNSSPSYSVTNGTVRFQTRFVTAVTFFGILFLILIYNFVHLSTNENSWNSVSSYVALSKANRISFNSTYPLTVPKFLPQGIQFRIGIIADLDTNSKSKSNSHQWISYLQFGNLIWNSEDKQIILQWDTEPLMLESGYGLSGRGMELSELIVFDGKLLAFDDRTGFVYQIIENKVIPWVVLVDGDGKQPKGFKTEWATVRNGKLYIGGVGKEWTTEHGDYVNEYPMWIKVVHPNGHVEHVDWNEQYKKLRRSVGIEFPGYMIHEAAAWSHVHNKWFFLPRRCSHDRYNDVEDEHKSTNVLLSTDDTFDNIEVTYIGDVTPLRGYSSFKFVPTTNDEVIIALKSEEFNNTFATYITAFTITGDILLHEMKIAGMKYEGIEFV